VDTRSDIYSLGVLLYELLSGRTPFDSKTLIESGVDGLRRTLREREPQPPSTLLTTLGNTELTTLATQRHSEPVRLISSLRGDLDWIVMKAMEKDRGRRYQTANALAMEVQRYLNNEPVVARPPSSLYRLQKLVRRNQVTFAAIAAVALALFIGLGVSTWSFLEEHKARQRAVAAEQQQIRLRKEADRLREQAENRQKLTQATVSLSRDKIEEADRLVAGIPVPEPNLEYAALFRTLGDWHSVHGRWKQAADRFAVLVQVNQPDDWDITTLDYLRYGPLLLELGDLQEYDRFRELAVAHYARTTNPLPAERVVKISLLTPADAKLLAELRPLAEIAAKSLSAGDVDVSLAAWRSFSLALMEYRRGNYGGAQARCERAMACSDANASRDANLKLVLAMTHIHVGKDDLARSELAQAREKIESRFNQGLEIGAGAEGFWFDWVFARVLLREAVALIGESHHWKLPEDAAASR
jgi:eukaryotic-like serine/threonine-protein kinase